MSNRSLLAAALIVAASVGLFASCSRAIELRQAGRALKVPEGFTVERVAGPGLADRPIVADFDEQGRLYVADSSGTNDPVQKQLQEKPHRILRLEDLDGDGRFDRRTIFADRMMFPEGAMWLDGSLYISAPPSIWKLTDTDGDGVADRREEWFEGKTLTGCANDLHGPYLGPDGWVYWAKGAFAEQTYERPGGPPFVTRASHLFRWRADRAGIIEPVMTGGMDNPVDVVFTPGGERIFTTTFLQQPGGGRRDGLIHAVYGAVYGKVHNVIEGHPRTRPDVMPPMTHLGPAAPCGLTRYESEALGPEYRDNLFACLFNLHKVTRHVLVPDGATFTTQDEDFVTSDDLDFHPTDVLEDADGSLLVIDTGGWYKLCCPTSQLHKPDVLGGIYRVRRAGAPRVDDPRGLRLDWDGADPAALVGRLDDPRPAVRRRAVATLAKRGAVGPLAEAIRSAPSAGARRHAVWAAARIDADAARAAVRPALDDADEAVRQAALHAISVRKDAGALNQLTKLIKGGALPNRRAAAEALGRIGDASAVPALLEAVAGAEDRVLEHSLTYALIEIADPEATRAGLAGAAPRARRAALVALDQMRGGGLAPETVAPLLAADDPETREVAAWIAGRHPDWGDALAGRFREPLERPDLPDAEREALADQLARFAGADAIQGLLARQLEQGAPPSARDVALRAMARSGRKDVPTRWLDALARALESGEPDLTRRAVATARALPLPKDAEAVRRGLLRLAEDRARPAELRLEALAALPGGPGTLGPEPFALLREQLADDRPVAARMAAADVLARANLNPEQLSALADALREAGPLEVNRLLPAFARSGDEALGLRLLAALEGSPARSALRPEALRPVLEKYPAAVKERAEDLYAKLDAGAADQRARLEEVLSSLAEGDVYRGQAVFMGSKAACATCHAIGYLGGKVGPDLTKIGQVRTGRDLLESILFPSASFVRSYEPMLVATRDGRVVSGILRQDGPEGVVLATSATEEARIPREEIEEMRPGTVSVMPAGLDAQLSPQELADLVAFLQACGKPQPGRRP